MTTSNNIGRQSADEINRLKNALRILEEQKIQLENNNRKFVHDLEIQIQNFNAVNKEKEDLKRTEYESRLKMTNSIN